MHDSNGEDSGGKEKKDRGLAERIQVWMINDGESACACRSDRKWLDSDNAGMGKIFLVFWVALHVIALGLAILHYQMKDNLDGARSSFGWTFGKLLDPLKYPCRIQS